MSRWALVMRCSKYCCQVIETMLEFCFAAAPEIQSDVLCKTLIHALSIMARLDLWVLLIYMQVL